MVYSVIKKTVGTGERMMKKELKKQVNQTARSIFIYQIILTGVTFLYVLCKSTALTGGRGAVEGADQIGKVLLNHAMDNAGLLSLAGTAAGLLYLALRYRKNCMKKEMFHTWKPMKTSAFLAVFCGFMSCQAVFAAAASLAELLLNPLGYTLAKSVESASSVNTTLSMFIYSTLAAPAAEELVFRGYVLRRMLPYGKEFAIVISAVLFGLMHGNFVQGLFAAGTGLVLGYVAVEYSLKWSILIHLLNNLVFSDLLGRIAGVTAEPLKSVLEYGISAAFFAAACVILFLNREAIGRWRRENRIGGRYYFYAFTTVWMILFILMEVLTAMNGIGKI